MIRRLNAIINRLKFSPSVVPPLGKSHSHTMRYHLPVVQALQSKKHGMADGDGLKHISKRSSQPDSPGYPTASRVVQPHKGHGECLDPYTFHASLSPWIYLYLAPARSYSYGALQGHVTGFASLAIYPLPTHAPLSMRAGVCRYVFPSPPDTYSAKFKEVTGYRCSIGGRGRATWSADTVRWTSNDIRETGTGLRRFSVYRVLLCDIYAVCRSSRFEHDLT